MTIETLTSNHDIMLLSFVISQERIIKDVRSGAPDEFNINVYRPEDPIVEAWKGGGFFYNIVTLCKLLFQQQLNPYNFIKRMVFLIFFVTDASF